MPNTLEPVAEPRHEARSTGLKPRNPVAEVAVVLWAIAAATHSQYSSLVNHYVVNGDAPSPIYWLQRFREPLLFRDDLLTDFAVQMHGQWGFVLFYRLLALVAEPLFVSRFMPILLLTVFALYVYKFVRFFSTTYAGVLTAGLAVMMPTYLEIMSGGHQRAFALPMLASFMYYLATGARRTACLILALLAMFYPMVFLVCGITYALSLASPPWNRASLRQRVPALALFAAVLTICSALLALKYTYAPNPQIGRLVTRAEMEGRSEFYVSGRAQVLPTAGLLREFGDHLVGLSRALTLGYPHMLVRGNSSVARKTYVVVPAVLGVLVVGVCFGLAVRRGREVVPKEIPYLVMSGALLYVLADLVLFRLYLPNRYLIYTVHIAGLLMVGLVGGYVINCVRIASVRRVIQVLLLAMVAARIDLAKGVGLTDTTANRPLYEYLATLPANTVIASHPDLGDFIPTFSRRKVFVNFELSVPFFTTYWTTITERTKTFFDAYYAESRQEAYAFCVLNGIDYLVVRARDFDPDYLSGHRIYFEPFDAYVRARLAVHHPYALAAIGTHEMLFRYGDTFVISKDSLKDLEMEAAQKSHPIVAPILSMSTPPRAEEQRR